MQYESNPANRFRDIVRKRKTDALPHVRHLERCFDTAVEDYASAAKLNPFPLSLTE